MKRQIHTPNPTLDWVNFCTDAADDECVGGAGDSDDSGLASSRNLTEALVTTRDWYRYREGLYELQRHRAGAVGLVRQPPASSVAEDALDVLVHDVDASSDGSTLTSHTATYDR